MPDTPQDHQTLPVEQTLHSPNPDIRSTPDTAGTNAPPEDHPDKKGALGWGILWLIGIPIPILLLLFVMRGCT